MAVPAISRLDLIVVHHSASKVTTTAAEIRRWHLDKGWSDIGYGWVIEGDGTIREGRPIPKMGAHAPPHNRVSWGVCVVGDNTTPDPEAPWRYRWRRADHRWNLFQKQSLRLFVEAVRLLVPRVRVRGHRDVGSTKTSCPGLTLAELAAIVGDVGA